VDERPHRSGLRRTITAGNNTPETFRARRGERGHGGAFERANGQIVLRSRRLSLTLTWFRLLRSFRLLNASRFAVIGALEQRLPASPFWHGEWGRLKTLPRFRRYKVFGEVQQYLPVLFALAYIVSFTALTRR
jgi:hypothetical protein